MYDLFLSQRFSVRLFRHLFLFLSMILLFSWVAWTGSEEEDSLLTGFTMVFINALFFFGYAYLTVYLLIPFFLTRRKSVWFVLLFLVSGFAISTLKFIFSGFVFYEALATVQGLTSQQLTVSSVLVNTKDMTFIVALFALAKYARDHYLLETNIRELQNKGMEAELKLIEHHLDPHVIFNNFNNLYSISINRPEFLEPTVKKIKTLLHYLFSESRSYRVPLSKEIEMIENYIGMEKLRFGDRLNITYQKEGKPGGLQIAPLILYAFVENCFVHGAGKDPSKSWIRIEVVIEGNRLCFKASNSVPPYERIPTDTNKPGTVINSVRRLELVYPERHRLAIREKRSEHHVELFVSL